MQMLQLQKVSAHFSLFHVGPVSSLCDKLGQIKLSLSVAGQSRVDCLVLDEIVLVQLNSTCSGGS